MPHWMSNLLVRGAGLVLGLPLITGSGLYWIDIADRFMTFYGLGIVGLAECFAVAVFFGCRRLRGRINESVTTTGLRFYMVGETFTGEDGAGLIKEYVRPEELDGQFDFPLYWQVVKTFLREEQDFRGLESMLQWNQGYYGSWAVMSNFLGNHDVPRALSHAAGQIADMWGNGAKEQGWNNPPGLPSGDDAFKRLRSAWTFLMSIPGIPLIYYGDEIGLAGANDPDNRRNMSFGSDLDPRERSVLEHVRKVSAARRCSKALRRGGVRTLFLLPHTYVFLRDCGDGYPALVALNPATETRTVEVEIPSDVDISGDSRFRDVLGAELSVTGRDVTLTLGPRSSALVLSEPGCVEEW